MNINKNTQYSVLLLFVVGLTQGAGAQSASTYDGFINPNPIPGGSVLAQSWGPTPQATQANCPETVKNLLDTVNAGYACLPGPDANDIRTGCSPVFFNRPGILENVWIYPSDCYSGDGHLVDPQYTGGVQFSWTSDYMGWVTPKDGVPPAVPADTTPPTAQEFMPSDQQGPAYNFQNASNVAHHGALGLQVHVHFAGTMNRFVLRIPKNWNGKTLIVAAANGLVSEHTYDRTVSDWAVANGFAYMGSNKGSYMQTTFAGKWSAGDGKYLPLQADGGIDDAACQFAPDTYFNPLFNGETAPDHTRPDGGAGIQNNHKFVHIPSLIGRRSENNVLMGWRDSFILAVKTAKNIVQAHKGIPVTETIAFGVSSGGGVVKSVAEYAEPPATKFVDGVLEIAGIQLSTDSNNIMGTYNAMIQNWPAYVGSPPPSEAPVHFDKAGMAYANIQIAGFPEDLFNVNDTQLPQGPRGYYYLRSFPATPRQDLNHPDLFPYLGPSWVNGYRDGGLYFDWTMNANVYFLQCMFIKGFDPTYLGRIEDYPVSRISDPTSDVYKRLQRAGAHTGAINTPVVSLGGSDDSFVPPKTAMHPYHASITSPTITHRKYEFQNAGHVDGLATSGVTGMPAFMYNSWNMHFMANKAKRPLESLYDLIHTGTVLPDNQCVPYCNRITFVGGTESCVPHVGASGPCTTADFTEFGIAPGLSIPDILW